MSAGVFTLQGADVKTVMTELDKVFGAAAQSPLAGLLRIVPIERMNALLVISPNPAYLEEAKKWIERLDRGDASGGLRFFVYHLQNQRAEKLAPLLQQAITGRAPPAAAPAAPTLAPGTPAGTIVNPPQFQAQPAAAAGDPDRRRPAAGRRRAAVARGHLRRRRRHRAQRADRRRQGQQHDHRRRLGRRVLGARGGAEEARRAAAPGDDRGRHRRGVPARPVRVRRRVVFHQRQGPGRRAVPPRHEPGQHLRAERRDDRPTSASVRACRASRTCCRTSASPAASRRRSRCSGINGNAKVVANPHVAALDNQKATIKVGDRIPINQQTFVGSGVGRRPTRSRRPRSTSTPACCCR